MTQTTTPGADAMSDLLIELRETHRVNGLIRGMKIKLIADKIESLMAERDARTALLNEAISLVCVGGVTFAEMKGFRQRVMATLSHSSPTKGGRSMKRLYFTNEAPQGCSCTSYPHTCHPVQAQRPSYEQLEAQNRRYAEALDTIIAADQHTGERADIAFDLDGPFANYRPRSPQPYRRLIEMIRLPEAKWVTEMREHKALTGTYRQEDLDRLLGKPWESVRLDADGKPYIAGGLSND